MTNFRPTTLSPEALKIWDEADANIKASMQRIRELTAPLRRPGSAGLKEEAMTTAPDFRALCAELVELLEEGWSGVSYQPEALNRARAALATPPTEPPMELPPLLAAALKLREENDLSHLFLPKPLPPQEPPALCLGAEWQPCVKLPITVHVREQRPGETHSSTREGITPLRHDDLIMRGVQGEEYPIGRELFNQTYRMGEALATPPPEPPTDEELLRKYGKAKRDHCYEGDLDDWPKKAERAATVAGLRAVLERWGRPATPPPEENTKPGFLDGR
jgi:hypothetical protein